MIGRAKILVTCLAAGLAAACSGGKGPSAGPPPPSASSTVPAAPSTTAPPTTTAPVTSLTVGGYGPGVEQAPFYPTTTITSVSCGSFSGGTFVLINLPPGPPGTPAHSALAAQTTAVVVPGHAELKDHTGKVLYNESPGRISTGRAGTLVLSLENVTYIGGDGRSVSPGVLNIAGDFTCPSGDVPFPGL